LSGSAAASPAARRARPGALSLVLLGLGVLLRVAQYLANRSLWLDEAYLASTILHRSFAGLLRPPDYGQIVPVGFLALERAAAGIFGDSEYALRLVPLAAGLASLFLFRRVALRMLPARAATFALALFVFCDPLIAFSSELKQYSLDVLIALLLLDWALDVQENPGKRAPLARAAVLGAVLVWFSLPCIFVLAGIGSALLVRALFRRDRGEAAALMGTGILWVASFAVFDAVWLSKIGRSPEVLAFWSRAFLPLPPRSLEDLYWLPRALGAVFGDPVGFVFRGLGVFCFLVGAAALFSSQRLRLALLAAPLLFTLLASALKRYPFEGRLLLFLVPSILLLISAGAEHVRGATAERAPAVAVILVTLMLFHPALFAARSLLRPRTREETRPVLSHVRERLRPGDRLYVYAAAAPAFDYYALRLGLPASAALRGTWAGEDGEPQRDLERLRGGGRTWVLFSHATRAGGRDDEKRFLDLLDPVGIRVEAFRAPGAAVYLYVVDGAGPSAAGRAAEGGEPRN